MNSVADYKEYKRKYYQDYSSQYRKSRGQIFTPLYIAEFMADWVLAGQAAGKILDPALGLGAFFQMILRKDKEILQKNKNIHLQGIEKDLKLYRQSKLLYSPYSNIAVEHGDYLSEWGREYAGIICNPPYLIYKKYNNKKMIALFNDKLALDLSGFTNLAMLFLLKSISELKEKGRMAYLLPADFLNADYGHEIKKMMLDYGYLRFVIILDYNLFVEKTTSAILLFSNQQQDQEISFINISSKREFLSKFRDNNDKKDNIKVHKDNNQDSNKYYTNELSSVDNCSFDRERLDVREKWRIYYQKSLSKTYNNLVKFSEYARVARGIATGANDFFLFNNTKKNEYKIDGKHFLPCLSKAGQVSKHFFTDLEYDKLKKEDKKIHLLAADSAYRELSEIKEKNTFLYDYIKAGENQGYHLRYLTARRKPWYKLEHKIVAPILVKVFYRKSLFFIFNEAEVFNLTAFHSIYLKTFKYEKLFKAYLLTEIAQKIIEKQRREYGNGLYKLEPNDLNNSFVLNLRIIKQADRQRICRLFDSIRQQEISEKGLICKKTSAKDTKSINLGKEEISNKVKILNNIFLKYLAKKE